MRPVKRIKHFMKIILTSIIFLTFTFIAFGQNVEPLCLAKKIFSTDSIIQLKKYYTGEYEGNPSGKDLQKGTITKFSLLEKKAKAAVVAMTLIDTTGKGIDTYLYFEKDKTWKMNSFRSLAMTELIEAVRNELEIMSPEQIANIIKKSEENKKSKNVSFASIEEYNFLLGNAKLTLELDENIIKHFLKNQSEFERIKNLALAELEKSKVDNEISIKLVKKFEADYKKILIHNVSFGGYELGNCVNFLIGGILDNTVGYIYIRDKKDLPVMSDGRVIMIKEIENGWYIYKTT